MIKRLLMLSEKNPRYDIQQVYSEKDGGRIQLPLGKYKPEKVSI